MLERSDPAGKTLPDLPRDDAAHLGSRSDDNLPAGEKSGASDAPQPASAADGLSPEAAPSPSGTEDDLGPNPAVNGAKVVDGVLREIRRRALATEELEQILCNPKLASLISQLMPPVEDPWSVQFPNLTSFPKPNGERRPLSICIATEDIVGPVRNGGIGTTYAALAEMLARDGWNTTVLYLRGNDVETGTMEQWVEYYAEKGVNFVPVPNYAHRDSFQTGADRWLRAPYNMLRYLIDHPMDVVHVSEWRGSGYLSLLAKRQGLAFQDTLFVVKTSSPWMWNRLYGSQALDRLEDLAKIYAERRSVELADMVIGGSAHLLRWMMSQGYQINRQSTFVQPNFVRFDHLKPLLGRRDVSPGARVPIDEIVFFGRLEARKGLFTFCQAIRRLMRQGVKLPPKISFMGKPGAKLSARPNQTILEYIEAETKDWPVKVEVLTEFQQQEAIEYLLGGARLAVMPSTIENSSMAVYEAAICGIPCVASAVGGTPELIRPEDHPYVLCDPHPISLGDRIAEAIEKGGYVAGASFDNDVNVEIWRDFHKDLSKGLIEHLLRRRQAVTSAEGSVSVCVYHTGDLAALERTLASLGAQDVAPSEVLVAVDAPLAAATADVQTLLRQYRFPSRAVETFDQDIGLSFNTLADEARSDFLLFVWEGTDLKNHAIRVLKRSAHLSGADVLSFFYREVDDTPETAQYPLKATIVGSVTEAFFRKEVSAQPLFVKAEAFHKVQGFSTDYRVLGYDHEFLAKAQLSGLHCETALIELATVPTFKKEWLSDRCYDEQLSYFRAIRPQLAAAPLAMRDLLLMAKGLSARTPGPRPKKIPGTAELGSQGDKTGKPGAAQGKPKGQGSFESLIALLEKDIISDARPPAAPAPAAVAPARESRPQSAPATKRPAKPGAEVKAKAEPPRLAVVKPAAAPKPPSPKPAPPAQPAGSAKAPPAPQAEGGAESPNRPMPRPPARVVRPEARPKFNRRLIYVHDGALFGWVADNEAPDQVLSIEAVSEGRVVATVRADLPVPPVRPGGTPDAKLQGHGFQVQIFPHWVPLPMRRGSRKVDLRIAGTDQYIQREIEVFAPNNSIDQTSYDGYAEFSADRVIRGWAWNRAEDDRVIDVAIFVENQFVGCVTADDYREDLVQHHIGSGDHGFRLNFQKAWADGEERTLDIVVAENGLRLKQAPLIIRGNRVEAAPPPAGLTRALSMARFWRSG